jgi:methionyl-tRNA formyltransferase
MICELMVTAPSITVLAAGYKGATVTQGLLQAGLKIRRIVSYPQLGDQSNAFEALAHLASEHGVTFEESVRPTLDFETLVFVIGWQFLLSGDVTRCVVFHDSRLPALRGFAPTVTAMLQGESNIGITAFRPEAGVDCGPIYGQRVTQVPPDAGIRTVLDLQNAAMVKLALEIYERAAAGALSAVPQDEAAATYSLWRDAFDYFIDWRRPAEEILRVIRALGFPYDGAQAVIDDERIVIEAAQIGPDYNFSIRDPGKLWTVENGRPLVVCGRGTLWIDVARHISGKPYRFTKLRKRFLTADTAWIANHLRSSDS